MPELRRIIIWGILSVWMILSWGQNNDTTAAFHFIQQAESFYDAGNWDSAAIYFGQGAKVWKLSQVAGNDTISRERYFYSLDKQAISFYNNNKLEKADSLFQRLIPEMKSVWGDKDSRLGNPLFHSGVAASQNRGPEAGIEIFLETLELRKMYLAEDDSLLAPVLSKLGRSYLDLDDFEHGTEYLLQGLSISQKHKGPLEFSFLRELGRAFYYLGDNERALEFYQQTLPILKSQNDPSYGQFVSFIGVLHKSMGNYELAVQYGLKALPILREVNQKQYAISLLDLGLAYDISGDRPKALDCYLKALPVFESLNEPYYLGSCFLNMGIVYGNMEEFDQALEYYQKALAIFKSNPDLKLASCLIGIGEIYSAMGDYEKALSFINEAVTVSQNVRYQDDPDISYDYILLGETYEKMGNSKKALKTYMKALKVTDLYPDFPARRLIFYHLGSLFNKLGEYEKALGYFQDFIALLLPGYDSSDPFVHPSFQAEPIEKLPFIVVLDEKAQTLRRAGNGQIRHLMAADTCYQLAIYLIEQVRQSYRNEDSKLDMQKNSREFYVKALQNCMDLYEKTGQQTYLNRALAISEKSKTAALFEALQSIRARQFSSIPSDVLVAESKIRVNLNRLQEVIFELESRAEKADSALLANYHTELFFQQQKYDTLLNTLEKSYPDYYRLKYQKENISPALVQSMLKGNEAFISYFLTDSTLHGFVFSKTQFTYFFQPVSQRFVSEIGKYRQDISSLTNDLAGFYSNSNHLYQILLQPIEEIIKNKNLIISPDGILATIPFEALIQNSVEEKSQSYSVMPYLFKDHGIAYTYSATFLVNQHKGYTSSRKTLAFAPSFNQNLLADNKAQPTESASTRGDTLRGSLLELKGTQRELRQLEKLLNTKSFIGQAATEAAFKAFSKDYGILHLATHAIINEETPLNSYLVFTANEDTTEDNNLYAWELYNMKLNAQMAVLSACNTGFGKLQRGEGVMSLGRAFAYAGVPSIVMSLWPVEDESTADLMGYFYKSLSEGMAKDEALRAAKIRFLEESAPDKRHPFYWAGFVVQGDAGPLEKGGFPVWVWVVIGLMMLGIGGFFLFRQKRLKD